MDELVAFYHRLHFSQKEILESLAKNHEIVISRRTLQRNLSKLQLYRRKFKSNPLEVADFIKTNLQTSGKGHGYKWMHLKCMDEGLVVDQETVRLMLLLLDPGGVKRRRRRRLDRRVYFNTGPNFTWHIDSNDKLKPYGIVINGCSDGFSRLIVWLKAQGDGKAISVANHFIQSVKCRNGCPMTVRTDFGVENGTVHRLQKFLRRNHDDSRSGNNSAVCGDSRTNQRIESWWNILRKQNLQFWMKLFKQLIEDNHFSGDFLDKNLVRYCFLEMIQAELDMIVSVWNKHRIRRSSYGPLPCGKPAVLYTLPHLYGFEDKLCHIDPVDLEVCEEEIEIPFEPICNSEVFELCNILMEENGLGKPHDPYDAVNVYLFLRRSIHQLIN